MAAKLGPLSAVQLDQKTRKMTPKQQAAHRARTRALRKKVHNSTARKLAKKRAAPVGRTAKKAAIAALMGPAMAIQLGKYATGKARPGKKKK